MEITMNKVANLTDNMYCRIVKDGKLETELRNLLGISKTKRMKIGDTIVSIGEPSKIKDVFKYVDNRREIFYVVQKPINEHMAFCYCIYPCC